MTPARFRWGIILIQIGILLLLQKLDIISGGFWEDLLYYIPIVLIAVGVEKIFTKTKLQFIAYTTSIFIFLAGFAIAFTNSLGYNGGFFSESTYQHSMEPQYQRLKAILHIDETDLTIRDSGSDLIYARFDQFTRKPKIDVKVDDNVANVTFESRPGSYLGGAIKINTDEPQDWYIRFSEALPVELECFGNDADVHLNMSTTHLENLKVDADKSTIYIKLGNLVPMVRLSVLGDASSVRLRVPADVGLKVLGEDYATYLQQIGMSESQEGLFTSPGFDTLHSKVEVEVDNRLSSFSIDYF